MSKRKELEGVEQIRALSHPLRLRLIELFARRPMTAKQAAGELEVPPTRLYHHVAALERAGLIVLRETRQNRGTTEKYFETVANRLEPSRAAVAGTTSEDHAALGIVVFDQARNELVQALAAGRADGRQPLIATRGVLQLTPSAAKKVAAELTSLLRMLDRSTKSAAKRPRPRTTQRYSLTIALIPTQDR